MGAVIGDILGIAVGVAISPIPIIAMVLIRSSARQRQRVGLPGGVAARFGVVGTIVLLVADPAGASADEGPAAWVGWLMLALGVLAILFGFRQWASRPAPGVTPEMPKWMQAIDGFNAAKSFGIGFLLAAVNPKNTTLTLAAAAAIAAAGLDTASSFVVLAIFVLVGSLWLLIPLLVYLVAGERAAHFLEGLQQWMGAHNAAIIRIWSRVGRRPLLAAGNSNGDIPILRYAGGRSRPALRLLVLHDDADREFDYTAGADLALKRAGDEAWTVISVKEDWSRVFADV